MLLKLLGVLFMFPLVSSQNEAESSCYCVIVSECKPLRKLVAAKKWDQLNKDFTLCGFEEELPKFCCPKS